MYSTKTIKKLTFSLIICASFLCSNQSFAADGEYSLEIGSRRIGPARALFLVTALAWLATANSEACPMPTGKFTKSCDYGNPSLYSSSDPLVPEACSFDGKCATMYAGLPKNPFTVYYPQGLQLIGGTNINGTLEFDNLPSTIGVTAEGETLVCPTPEGSYIETCTANAAPYRSSDSNLGFTSLCKLRASCAAVGGSGRTRLDTVYFPVRGAEGFMENCDGKLAPHFTATQQCAGKSPAEIKAVAAKTKLYPARR